MYPIVSNYFFNSTATAPYCRLWYPVYLHTRLAI